MSMSSEYNEATLAQVKETVTRLQSPITDTTTLYQLLSFPLVCLHILPPCFRQYDIPSLPHAPFPISRYIPALQRALLEHVLPTWEPILKKEGTLLIVEQYFCPDDISFASPASGEIAVHAYSTILSEPLLESTVNLLVKLSRGYPIDVLYRVVHSESSTDTPKREVTWEDCVRNLAALPTKVANALGPKSAILDQRTYLNNMCVRCELLISALAARSSRGNLENMTFLLTKLVNLGLFPQTKNLSPSQPSFFQATLSIIRTRLSEDNHSYSTFWRELLSSLSSSLTLQSIVASLIASLETVDDVLDTSPRTRSLVKREAQLIRDLFGRLHQDNGELLESFCAIALGRAWDEGYARIFACWTAGAESGQADSQSLKIILGKVVDMWTTPDHIRHSLLSRHQYLTSLLLLLLHSFRSSDSSTTLAFQELAFSPPFIKAISTYISHLDPAVRRCGMLVAEEVACGAGKKLDFGGWEDDNDNKRWCRQLRIMLRERDTDAVIELATPLEETTDTPEQSQATTTAIVAEDLGAKPGLLTKPKPTATIQENGYDSDDSLTGYASPPASSRSASPTLSELEEIEKDPTLRVGQQKIPRPVYLAQLGEMVRSTSGLRTEGEDLEVQKIEVALDVAEELTRRKKAYGTELEENAVNLTHGFLGLQDNYEINGFEEKRQAALTALVACCPRKAAPALIEEFFRHQYSTNQRFVILNALVLGARELATLPTPSPVTGKAPAGRIAFPSKRLPPSLHKKYLTSGDHLASNNPVQLLLDDISHEAMVKGREEAESKVPQIVRERQLRIRQPSKVSEVSSSSTALASLSAQTAKGSTTFTEIAAGYFICPLINRFWLFLRDEQSREARTAHQPALHRYRGAGTGLVLNAIVLARFLSSLAVLVHSARHSPAWLAVIAPDTLELAVTLGTRPISMSEGADEDEDENGSDEIDPSSGTGRKEAAVLTAALELALVVLDGALDLDGGRSLGLEYTTLLLGVDEWGKKVFSRLETGLRTLGEGGAHEAKLRRAAAGVVLKVDEVTNKWRRSMIDVVSV